MTEAEADQVESYKSCVWMERACHWMLRYASDLDQDFSFQTCRKEASTIADCITDGSDYCSERQHPQGREMPVVSDP